MYVLLACGQKYEINLFTVYLLLLFYGYKATFKVANESTLFCHSSNYKHCSLDFSHNKKNAAKHLSSSFICVLTYIIYYLVIFNKYNS